MLQTIVSDGGSSNSESDPASFASIGAIYKAGGNGQSGRGGATGGRRSSRLPRYFSLFKLQKPLCVYFSIVRWKWPRHRFFRHSVTESSLCPPAASSCPPDAPACTECGGATVSSIEQACPVCGSGRPMPMPMPPPNPELQPYSLEEEYEEGDSLDGETRVGPSGLSLVAVALRGAVQSFGAGFGGAAGMRAEWSGGGAERRRSAAVEGAYTPESRGSPEYGSEEQDSRSVFIK